MAVTCHYVVIINVWWIVNFVQNGNKMHGSHSHDCKYGILIKVFNILKKFLPLKHKIIYRTKAYHFCGECVFNEKKNMFIIIIDSGGDIQTQVDSMLHEYAHALRMDVDSNYIKHDKGWGSEYSRVWNCFDKYYLEDVNRDISPLKLQKKVSSCKTI